MCHISFVSKNNRNHCSQLRQVCLFIITSKQLWMEIKGFSKQLLILLQTLEAKFVSGHHMRRVYIIMEKMVCKFSCRCSQFLLHVMRQKLGFFRHFSGQWRCMLYMNVHYTWKIMILSVCLNLHQWKSYIISIFKLLA